MLRRTNTMRWVVRVVVAAALVPVSGCAVNPATGERQLVLMSEGQEVALGQEADQSVQQSMGLYPDDGLQTYIQEIGSSLAATSERPDLPWTFRVIDDPVVNAFALPGGFIYMTRGILSHFNSEAELSSVLGHEIGHVTGRHGVEQASRAQLATVGLMVGSIASERFAQFAGLAQTGLGLLFLRFSRDHERQADDLGLRYMTRGSFDPNEMPKVFRTLERVSASQGGGGRLPDWLSTHPNPGSRAERITQQVAGLSPDLQAGTVNRAPYLQRLQGLMFGENPREGYAIGRRFYQPDLEFQFDFPEGWQINNQRQAVGAISPEENAIVVLSLAGEETPAAATRAFFSQQGIEQGRPWQRGFTYFRTVASPTESSIVGIAGFFDYGGRVYTLLGYTPESGWSQNGRAMERSLGTFRRLTDRRYLDVQPKRVEIVQLDRAMTVDEFAQRHPSSVDLQELAILNGLPAGGRFEAGQRVKRIVGGRLPAS